MVTKFFNSPRFRFSSISLFLKDHLNKFHVVGFSVQQLEKYYNRIKVLLDGCDEIILDEQGTILTWNRSFQELKGYSEQEIIGQHLNLFFMPRDRQKNIVPSILAEAGRRGTACRFGQFIRKDGTIIWGSLKVTAIRSKNELLGYVALARKLNKAPGDEADS